MIQVALKHEHFSTTVTAKVTDDLLSENTKEFLSFILIYDFIRMRVFPAENLC